MIAETLADYCSSAVGLVKDREEVIGVIVIYFLYVYICCGSLKEDAKY